MENHPNTPEFQPFDDLVNVDTYGRGHRPDGKFLSGHELNQIGAHQEVIREGLPGAPEYIGRHRAVEVNQTNEQFALDSPLPPLIAQETAPGRVAAARLFFGRRAKQLSAVAGRTRKTLNDVFGENIADSDMRLTAMQTVRAHMHPHQLGRNAKDNIGAFIATLRNEPFRSAYDSPDRTPSHPVVRKKLYKDAMQGNAEALLYLGKYDKRLGKADWGYKDFAEEFLKIMTGAAVVRKIGLVGLMGVTIGEAVVARNNPEKQEKYERRFGKLLVKNKIEYTGNRFDKREDKYAAVAAKARPPYPSHMPPPYPSQPWRDPFRSL